MFSDFSLQVETGVHIPGSDSHGYISIDVGQYQHPEDLLPRFNTRSCGTFTQLAENASEHLLSRLYNPLLSDLGFLKILLERKS